MTTKSSAAQSESSAYTLGANNLASARLNLQFHLVQAEFAQRIFAPTILPLLSTPDLRIADVCTGTGEWLVRALPFLSPSTDSVSTSSSTASAELHAFDINLSNLPPPAYLPLLPASNRHVWNIHTPPPAEFKGYFDIVNISLTLLFVTDDTFQNVLRNVLQLVKPGGVLQWFEFDPRNRELYAFDEDGKDATGKLRYMNRITKAAWDVMGKDLPIWIGEVEQRILDCNQRNGSANGNEGGNGEDLGIELISSERPKVYMPGLPALMEVWFMTFDEFQAGLAMKLEGMEDGKERVDLKKNLEDYRTSTVGCRREVAEYGATLRFPSVRVVVRRK